MKKVLIIGTILMMAGMVMGQNYGTIGMPGGTLGGGELDSIQYKYGTLSSDVSMPSFDTWYDGPSVSLDTGTWLVYATGYGYRLLATGIDYRITDKTTHYSESTVYSSSAYKVTTLFALVNVTTTKTVYLQASSVTSGCSLLKNGWSGTTGTHIAAIKLSGY